MSIQQNTTLQELNFDEIDAVSGAGLVTNLLGTVGSLVGLHDPLTKIGSGLNETVTGTLNSLGLGALNGVINTVV